MSMLQAGESTRLGEPWTPMATRPDRCPKCGYHDVKPFLLGIGAQTGSDERGRCTRCKAELRRSVGVPFWRSPR